jgi:hypothetical protein
MFLRQCALAPTHDDRPEEQMALVDHPRGNRPPGQLGTPIVISASEVSLSLRIVAGSKLGSIRVLTLDTVWSVREYTIFSAASDPVLVLRGRVVLGCARARNALEAAALGNRDPARSGSIAVGAQANLGPSTRALHARVPTPTPPTGGENGRPYQWSGRCDACLAA